MKKSLLGMVLSLIALHTVAQDWPVKKQVAAAKMNQPAFSSMPMFRFSKSKAIAGIGTMQELSLDRNFIPQLRQQQPLAITINIPLSSNKSINCDLVRFSMGNVKFTENKNVFLEDIKAPLTYRGIINGEAAKNTIMLTVNDEYMSVMVSMADKTIEIKKAPGTNSGAYRVYNSKDVALPFAPIECGTVANGAASARGILLNGSVANPLALRDKCINVFIDCFDSLYQWCNSNTQQTVNYVYELFNSVTTGYYNDSINIQIIGVNVWSTADPYRGDTRENALADLATYWKDNFFGNICVGLDYSLNSPLGRSGLAGDIGRIKAVGINTCPAYDFSGNNKLSACCYCDMNYNVTVRSFPTGTSEKLTGQQVYLTMHEMGHLLGAHHTKWCGWKLTSNPDTYGTLDSCGVIEPVNNSTPPCPQGPPPSGSGATIMSYCVTGNTPNQYVNYFNGFGLLPGNAIRNFVDQSACILLCTACFGF